MEEYYNKVPKSQKERLFQFRKTHRYISLNVNGIQWDYLKSGGDSKPNLLLLTGGTRVGESYALYPHLEKRYNIISPTYPIVHTIKEMVDGIAAIVKKEQYKDILLLGTSLGGMIAQQFIREYPHIVKRVIISNTMSPDVIHNRRSNLVAGVLTVLPKFLVNKLTKRSLMNQWEVATLRDKDFWIAYMDDILVNYMSKKWIIAQFRLSNDFNNNYHYQFEDLQDWTGKMLIIRSENDPIFDAEIQKRLNALYPQAKRHLILGVGHTPAINIGEEFLSLVHQFFNEE